MTTQQGPVGHKTASFAFARWGAVVLMSAISLIFFISAFERAGRGDWEAAMLLFPISGALVYLTERVRRYFFHSQFIVYDDRVVRKRFLSGETCWAYADTLSWATEVEVITKSQRGRRLPIPLHIEYLVRTDSTGDVKRIILPGYSGSNEELLNDLAQRSGRDIKRNPTTSNITAAK
jgi:hypothetical protein